MAKAPSNLDEGKGRLKKALGELTGDERTKQEGRKDIATGKVKAGIDKVREKIDELTDDRKTDRSGPLEI